MNEKVVTKMPDLLSRAGRGLEITTRDDQDEFTTFLDAARTTRRKGGRLRLVDTGRFSVFELEWLAEAGADIYTSEEARTDRAELDLLAQAAGRGDAIVAHFHRGTLSDGTADVPSSWAFLEEVGRSGVDIHLSNREHLRDLGRLAEMADSCRKTGTRVVFYCHGRLEPGIEALARAGVWIHLSDKDFEDADEAEFLGDVIHQASAAGSGVILHLERGLPVESLDDFLGGGAFLIFKTPPSERGSRLHSVEQQARRRKLDRRSYYLHPVFLP